MPPVGLPVESASERSGHRAEDVVATRDRFEPVGRVGRGEVERAVHGELLVARLRTAGHGHETAEPGIALRALRAGGTGRASGTGRSGRANGPGVTLRTSGTGSTGIALRTGRTGGTLDALGTSIALRTLRASGTDRASGTGRTSDTLSAGVTLRAGGTRVTLRAGGTRVALRTLRAHRTHRADVTLRASRTDEALEPHEPALALLALDALGAGRTGIALRTLSPGLTPCSCGTSGALRPGRSGEAPCAAQTGTLDLEADVDVAVLLALVAMLAELDEPGDPAGVNAVDRDVRPPEADRPDRAADPDALDARVSRLWS